MRSANTPPTSENRTMGMLPRNESKPSMKGDLVMSRTSQACAKVCIERADAGRARAKPHEAEVAVGESLEDPADHF